MSEKKKVQAVADGAGGKKGKESGAKASKKGDEASAKPTGVDLSSRVSSLNDWEHADLGDDSRKNKFLRLMGAAKASNSKDKEAEPKPTRKFGGRQHWRERSACRLVTDAHKVEEELEEQFKEGLEHTLVSGHRGHVGLGFHDAAAAVAAEPKPRQNKITKFDDDDAAVVGMPNNDIAGPNRAEEYSDEGDDSGEVGAAGEADSAADQLPGEASSKRSGKKLRSKKLRPERDDDEVDDDDRKKRPTDDAPAAAPKKAKKSSGAAAAVASAGGACSTGKVKGKQADTAASTKKPSRMPAGFVKAVDA